MLWRTGWLSPSLPDWRAASAPACRSWRWRRPRPEGGESTLTTGSWRWFRYIKLRDINLTEIMICGNNYQQTHNPTCLWWGLVTVMPINLLLQINFTTGKHLYMYVNSQTVLQPALPNNCIDDSTATLMFCSTIVYSYNYTREAMNNRTPPPLRYII